MRAQLPSPAASCWLSLMYAKHRDLLRAGLYVETCDPTAVPEDVRDDVERATRELRKKLKDSELSELYVSTQPTGLVAEIDALPAEHFTTPATLWVAAGPHQVRAISEGIAFTNSITTNPHASAHLFLDAGKPKAAAPKDGNVRFDEGGDVGEQQDAPPPDVKHGKLRPKKYIDGGTSAGGELLDDPLAVHERFVPPHPPALRIGLRAGGGSFGHTGGDRIAPSVALVTRMTAPWEELDASKPFELGLRADLSRRGGDDARFDVFGASAELAKILIATDAAWIAGGLALRGDARTATMIGAVPVHGFGLAAGASIELSLRSLPIVFGVRYEQGLTELVDGIREHGVLIEAGVDLRRFRDRR